MTTEHKPDIRTDIMSEEQFQYNCNHYADYAYFTPPEEFLFHHYDEPEDVVLVCHRPMIGHEKYVVSGVKGGFYGIYDTRDVSKYIKTGTWIVLDSKDFFITRNIRELERQLEEQKAALIRCHQ